MRFADDAGGQQAAIGLCCEFVALGHIAQSFQMHFHAALTGWQGLAVLVEPGLVARWRAVFGDSQFHCVTVLLQPASAVFALLRAFGFGMSAVFLVT